jgi:hypothetical protein
MSDLGKKLAARLPHPLLYRVYLAWKWRALQRLSDASCRKAGVPPLAELDLNGFRRSDTVFILGSGSSINAIRAERWEAIARHDSIGLNLWPLHPFVPRVYCFEDMPPSEAPYPLLRSAFERRQDEYRDTLKIVNDCFYDGPQLINDLPTGWRTNLYYAPTMPAVARNASELAYCVRYLSRRGAFASSGRIEKLFKYGSNLIVCVSLAIRLGYKNLVLCGVDLKDQRYFYQDPELFPDMCDVEFLPRAQVHVTARSLDWLVPSKEVLGVLAAEVMAPRGIKLYVENAASGLHPEVPEAPASLFGA